MSSATRIPNGQDERGARERELARDFVPALPRSASIGIGKADAAEMLFRRFRPQQPGAGEQRWHRRNRHELQPPGIREEEPCSEYTIAQSGCLEAGGSQSGSTDEWHIRWEVVKGDRQEQDSGGVALTLERSGQMCSQRMM